MLLMGKSTLFRYHPLLHHRHVALRHLRSATGASRHRRPGPRREGGQGVAALRGAVGGLGPTEELLHEIHQTWQKRGIA